MRRDHILPPLTILRAFEDTDEPNSLTLEAAVQEAGPSTAIHAATAAAPNSSGAAAAAAADTGKADAPSSTVRVSQSAIVAFRSLLDLWPQPPATAAVLGAQVLPTRVRGSASGTAAATQRTSDLVAYTGGDGPSSGGPGIGDEAFFFRLQPAALSGASPGTLNQRSSAHSSSEAIEFTVMSRAHWSQREASHGPR